MLGRAVVRFWEGSGIDLWQIITGKILSGYTCHAVSRLSAGLEERVKRQRIGFGSCGRDTSLGEPAQGREAVEVSMIVGRMKSRVLMSLS